MLPHELVHTLYSHADPEVLMSVEGMNPGSQAHLQSAKTELGVADLLGLAVWGDGVPCNFDRTESLECFCLCLACQQPLRLSECHWLPLQSNL